MRQFEREIGGNRPAASYNMPAGPQPNFVRPSYSGPGGSFARPVFMPASVRAAQPMVRGQVIPPPPSYSRPEGLPSNPAVRPAGKENMIR